MTARAGFTPEEVATDAAALVEGEPAATPVISNDRVYTVRVRFPMNNRASVESVRDTVLTSAIGLLIVVAGIPVYLFWRWRRRE